MSLQTIISALVASSDADLETFFVSDEMPSLLHLLDDYFTRGTTLQTRMSYDHNKSKEAVVRALSVDSSAVFSLFLRLVDAQPHLLQQAIDCGLLHVTRLVPFCQLYGIKNGRAVADVLDTLVTNVAAFSTTTGILRQFYIQQLHKLHVAVVQTRQDQVVDLIQSIYELSLSLSGMTTATSMIKMLLLDGKDIETEMALRGHSMIYSLMHCYETSLPILQQHVATFDDEVATLQRPLFAETRQTLLEILRRCVDVVMDEKDLSRGEKLLAGLHVLSNGSLDDDAEHGSFLSDLWYLCEYKEKVADYFDCCKLELDNFSYLDMVIEELPRRRILPTMLINDLAAEAKPKAIPFIDSENYIPPMTSNMAEKAMPACSEIDETETLLASMIYQVQDFFPDLGNGYVELCLLCSNLQVEVVVNFLLESNPPSTLVDVPQYLKRSDSEFARLKAQVTGKPSSAVTIETSPKLDPSRVWVGKKTMEKMYDPQLAKKDYQLVEKMKQLVVMYEEEDEYGRDGGYGRVEGRYDGVAAPDEYDDDYNDEYDDFVQFSIRDGGSADDQDAICEQNRKLRAKERKDAFWEDMKNRNRETSLVSTDKYEDNENEGVKDDSGENKPFRSISGQSEPLSGSKHRSTRPKDKKQDGDKKLDEPLTPQQIQRQRARKDKNKAKVANHNRKDRAMKKMR